MRQVGFTYVAVLFGIAILGVGLAATGTVWHVSQQREKEQELLFVGAQFREAIGRYYMQTPGSIKHYPRSLADLIRDPRAPDVRRHLRRIYHDPITGKPEWGLVFGPDGGIMGVYSLSSAAPIKHAQFAPEDRAFAGKDSYAQWRFIHAPSPVPATPALTQAARRAVD